MQAEGVAIPAHEAELPLAGDASQAEPRSEWITSPVLTGSPATAGLTPTSVSYRSEISSPDRSIVAMPVHPESIACSARYSSVASPRDAAFTRIGRSFDTTVTAAPSLAMFMATARMRLSFPPVRIPDGRTEGSVLFSSTRSVPSSPTGTGKSRRPCSMRSSSRWRRACRAKYPISGS